MLSLQVIGRSAPRAGSGAFSRARPGRGFTLIELLVAIVIVAILAALAYPSYRSQIQKTRRVDAQGVLMQGAQFMERRYTEDVSYTVAGFPFTKSPIDGSTSYYTISVALRMNGAVPIGFTITATANPNGPENGQAPLTLDDAGTRVGWVP